MISTYFQDLLHRTERITSMTLRAAKYIIIGEIYIFKRADTFRRVKAIRNFMDGGQFFCECFFIDVGQFEAIAHSDLYRAIDGVPEIPPQAICFKLFGFDELYRCPRIQRYFSAWLIGKHLFGCLMMAKAQYQIQVDHGIKWPKVSITPFVHHPKFMLYKPILLAKMGESLPKPTFSNGIVNAKVSHISPLGLVYFHLDEQSIDYIGTLIQQFVSDNQQLTCRFRFSEASHCVVLIYDIERNIYHRAKIITVETGSPSTKYKCYCMDTGDTRSVTVSEIFTLNENSILNYYPGQAVPALLHSVCEDTEIERLKDILTNSGRIQVKAIDQKDNFPVVIVYKHSLNINELIRLEFELHK